MNGRVEPRSKTVARVFIEWIPFAILATVFCVLIAVAAQQVLRQSADDPQVQLAEDTATAIGSSREAGSIGPEGEVDLATSLAPFVIVFDDSGKPLRSSARIDDQTPIPPNGVFDYTKSAGFDRFTWQPRSGVRLAAVVVPTSGASPGFVLAGRSLREIERRIDQIQLLVLVGWVAALGVTFVAVAVRFWLKSTLLAPGK